MFKILEKAKQNNISLWVSDNEIIFSGVSEADGLSYIEDMNLDYDELLGLLKNSHIFTKESFQRFTQCAQQIEALNQPLMDFPDNNLIH
jgi:hypothetical protein